MRRRAHAIMALLGAVGVASLIELPIARSQNETLTLEAWLGKLREPNNTSAADLIGAIRRLTAESIEMRQDAVLRMPVGTILAYVGPTPPAGWLFCNGASFDRNRYPELAKLLNGNQTPDLHGQFLRGTMPGRDVLSRQAWATGLPRERAFGTNVAGVHAHGIFADQQRAGGGGGFTVPNSGTQAGLIPTTESGNHSHVIVSGGDGETRPDNVAVNYIIFTGVTSK